MYTTLSQVSFYHHSSPPALFPFLKPVLFPHFLFGNRYTFIRVHEYDSVVADIHSIGQSPQRAYSEICLK